MLAEIRNLRKGWGWEGKREIESPAPDPTEFHHHLSHDASVAVPALPCARDNSPRRALTRVGYRTSLRSVVCAPSRCTYRACLPPISTVIGIAGVSTTAKPSIILPVGKGQLFPSTSRASLICQALVLTPAGDNRAYCCTRLLLFALTRAELCVVQELARLTTSTKK